jgi:hypothetical protein
LGIVHTSDSAHARELAKWESHPTPQCPNPLRPYVYSPVPAMCYYAERPVGGGQISFKSEIAHTEDEIANMRSRGWGVGQLEAIQELESRERGLAVAAAERHHVERRMSERARAEAEEYDASVIEHVGEIPETPVRRRGRPKSSPE